MHRGARWVTSIAVVFVTASAAHAQAVLNADVVKQSFAGNTAEMVGQSNIVYEFWVSDGSQRINNANLGPDRVDWRITPAGEFGG